MGILSGDIKLVASQVMDDVDEGGGAPTSNVIQDGTSNSIFNDISEMDRAGGRVNLRKVFPTVQTPTTDTYLGANVIVADAPDDPNVSVTIFKTSDPFDRRTDAQDRIEAYLNKASAWDGFLFENHIQGQRSIQIFHREDGAPPVSGKTLYLAANEGLPNEYYQYVRVIDTESEVRTFSYSTGSGIVDYKARVTTCTLSDALSADFPGSPANRLYQITSGKTVLRDTLVADASTYFGAVKTTTATSLGAVKVKVDSIFTKIVPSAQSETGLVDRPLSGAALPMVASADVAVSQTVSAAFAPSGLYVLPTGVYPGSLSLTISGNAITDDALGNVIYNTATVGTINYATGEINFNADAPAASGSCLESYRPATGVSMQSYTLNRAVTAESRGYVWVIPLTPLPAPNSVVISYMAQGNWYELRDNGAGVLKGSDPAYGVGTVSYVTGTANVTLGALPDVGSRVMVAWGTQQEFVPLTTTSLAVEAPRIEFDLGQPVAPASLVLNWMAGAVAKTATDNGNGVITGDATGEVNYGAGTGWIRATVLPNAAAITVDFDSGAGELYGTTLAAGPTATINLPNAPIKPKSVVLTFTMSQELQTPGAGLAVAASSKNIPVTVRDDGSGNLLKDGVIMSGASINYTTGVCILSLNDLSSFPVAVYETKTIPPILVSATA
jgi:hypothetical protein